MSLCNTLEGDGYFEFEGRDQDGWPHWKSLKAFDIKGVDQQETLLIEKSLNTLISTMN